MTSKTDLPPVPPALADVAFIDGPTCAAANGDSLSRWLERVRDGDAPQPKIRQPRYTRWLLSDIRAYLIERAAHAGEITNRADAVTANARQASAAAQAKRASALRAVSRSAGA